jgi:hypothetical protein
MRSIYELASFRISTIGLAALLKVLENIGWYDFIQGLYTLIQDQHITVDLQETDQCLNMLRELIEEEKPSNSPIKRVS